MPQLESLELKLGEPNNAPTHASLQRFWEQRSQTSTSSVSTISKGNARIQLSQPPPGMPAHEADRRRGEMPQLLKQQTKEDKFNKRRYKDEPIKKEQEKVETALDRESSKRRSHHDCEKPLCGSGQTTLPTPQRFTDQQLPRGIRSRCGVGLGFEMDCKRGCVRVRSISSRLVTTLQVGDELLTVDGVNVNGQSMLIPSLIWGEKSSKVSLRVLRECEIVDERLLRQETAEDDVLLTMAGGGGRACGVGVVLEKDWGSTQLFLVKRVVEDSPAKMAGVQRGDLLVEIDGADLRFAGKERLPGLLLGPEGSIVSLRLIRNGRYKEVSVVRRLDSARVQDSNVAVVVRLRAAEAVPSPQACNNGSGHSSEAEMNSSVPVPLCGSSLQSEVIVALQTIPKRVQLAGVSPDGKECTLHILPDFEGVDGRGVETLARELVAQATRSDSALRRQASARWLASAEVVGHVEAEGCEEDFELSLFASSSSSSRSSLHSRASRAAPIHLKPPSADAATSPHQFDLSDDKRGGSWAGWLAGDVELSATVEASSRTLSSSSSFSNNTDAFPSSISTFHAGIPLPYARPTPTPSVRSSTTNSTIWEEATCTTQVAASLRSTSTSSVVRSSCPSARSMYSAECCSPSATVAFVQLVPPQPIPALALADNRPLDISSVTSASRLSQPGLQEGGAGISSGQQPSTGPHDASASDAHLGVDLGMQWLRHTPHDAEREQVTKQVSAMKESGHTVTVARDGLSGQGLVLSRSLRVHQHASGPGSGGRGQCIPEATITNVPGLQEIVIEPKDDHEDTTPVVERVRKWQEEARQRSAR